MHKAHVIFEHIQTSGFGNDWDYTWASTVPISLAPRVVTFIIPASYIFCLGANVWDQVDPASTYLWSQVDFASTYPQLRRVIPRLQSLSPYGWPDLENRYYGFDIFDNHIMACLRCPNGPASIDKQDLLNRLKTCWHETCEQEAVVDILETLKVIESRDINIVTPYSYVIKLLEQDETTYQLRFDVVSSQAAL